jgi:ribosomal protein S12 methylthiotransferase
MNILVISLGCDKNLVDSEVMLGLLNKRGYQMTDDEAKADIIIVNTCCFILDAKEESIENLLEMAKYREAGSCKALIATGCLAERYRDEIIEEIPQVDAVLGTNSYDEIVKAIDEALGGNHYESYHTLDTIPEVESERIVTTGGYYAYLKIAEGCEKNCTYCIIPSVRGAYRSVPLDQLVNEAKQLAKGGARELILVAQETTMYGTDLYGKKRLHELLHELGKIDGVEWIRILYCYPEEIYPELVAEIRDNKKVVHYLDMPIQSASDAVLKRMGRKTNRASIEQIIHTLREEIPDIALRTTLIAGFPGETQEDHETTMQFINDMEFDRLGVFAYSPEENTPAARMKDQIPDETKQQRCDAIMELQAEVAGDINETFIGRELTVMVEGKMPDENVYATRTYRDTPKVDGYLFVECPYDLMSGQFLRVRVTGAYEYDLIGEMIDESAE